MRFLKIFNPGKEAGEAAARKLGPWILGTVIAGIILAWILWGRKGLA